MRFASSGLLILLAAAPSRAQQPPVIDNDQVKVLVVTDEPRRKSALHEHAMNRVMIYLDGGENRLTYEGGRMDDQKFRAGEVRWSPAGGRHISVNPGDKPFRVVEVELKGKGHPFTPPQRDPVKLDPQEYKVLIDNDQVRVLRVRIAGNKKVPLHEHARNRVVVYLTDQRNRVTDEGGKVTEATAKAGEVRWAGPAVHSEQNLSDQPFEVVVVELK
jgi:beta-alanine degradation protein BauB